MFSKFPGKAMESALIGAIITEQFGNFENTSEINP
jgi:hypothetical protein